MEKTLLSTIHDIEGKIKTLSKKSGFNYTESKSNDSIYKRATNISSELEKLNNFLIGKSEENNELLSKRLTHPILQRELDELERLVLGKKIFNDC